VGEAVGGEGARARGLRSHLSRFGLVYVLVAVWLTAVVVLPSRPLEDRSAATSARILDPGAGPVLDPSAGPAAALGPGVGPATGPGAGGADGVRAGAPGAGTTGVTKGGVSCAPGVRQLPDSVYSAPCVPAWSGDNGGATHRGVTEDTIRIVRRRFPESANSQAVDAVIAQAGGADHAVIAAVRERFIREFEAKYELYGRRVEWVPYESQFGNDTAEVQGRGREGACLDAEVIANELHAFAVMGERTALSKPFTECAVQRGLVVIDGASYASETFYRDRHPYAWAIITDCERINYQVVEYVAKRLVDRPARWAGDADLRGRRRKLGVYTPVPDPTDTTCPKVRDSETARYGFEEEIGSRYEYVLDVSRFPDEAARGVIQLKRDGVTTVVMACDPISMIFLTQSATSQGWHPEWFLIGVALTDVDNAARLYDQDQVDGHLFGMSQLGATPKLLGPNSESGRLYQRLTGTEIPAGTTGQLHFLLLAYNLLQSAGPNLTPANLGAGAYTLPPMGAPDYPAGYWSFLDGPNGAVGARDHTLVDDSREVYWRGDVRSPADGKAGAYVETYGGRRFRNGEWPAEEPPVYPERG
jgi:hypothetical protein